MFRQPENQGIDCRLFETIIELNDQCSFHNLMDIYIVGLGPGEAILETPIGGDHLNPQDIAHGGVAFSLADTAMGMAIRSLNYLGATIEMNINYIRPVVISDTIQATGKILELGKTIIVAEAKVVNKEGKTVAITRGTYFNRGQFLEI